jgi:hypothetical protein
MTNEMLQGIRVLKLCAWESIFCSRITSARNQELRLLDRDSLYWALMSKKNVYPPYIFLGRHELHGAPKIERLKYVSKQQTIEKA